MKKKFAHFACQFTSQGMPYTFQYVIFVGDSIFRGLYPHPSNKKRIPLILSVLHSPRFWFKRVSKLSPFRQNPVHVIFLLVAKLIYFVRPFVHSSVGMLNGCIFGVLVKVSLLMRIFIFVF